MPARPALVGGADAIPDHVRDDRRAMVGNDHDLHAVGERELTCPRFGARGERGLEESKHWEGQSKEERTAEPRLQHLSDPL